MGKAPLFNILRRFVPRVKSKITSLSEKGEICVLIVCCDEENDEKRSKLHCNKKIAMKVLLLRIRSD